MQMITVYSKSQIVSESQFQVKLDCVWYLHLPQSWDKGV